MKENLRIMYQKVSQKVHFEKVQFWLSMKIIVFFKYFIKYWSKKHATN